MRRGTAGALALLLGAAACGGGTEPEFGPATWALVRIGDATLPARVADETWLADTIRFADAAWSRSQVVRLHAPGAPPDAVVREMEGFVTRRGARIVLDFDCGDGVLRSCVAPDTLAPAGGALVRRPNLYGAATTGAPLFWYEPVP